MIFIMGWKFEGPALGILTISVIFLVIYLIISTNKENLKNLPSRTMYSYSITLLIPYPGHVSLYFLQNNFLENKLPFYLCYCGMQMQHYWTFVIACEYWRLIYNSMKKRKVAVEGQTKLYLVYCFFGWILPAALVAASGTIEVISEESCRNFFTNKNTISSCNRLAVLSFLIFYVQYLTKFCCMIFALFEILLFVYIVMNSRVESNIKRNYLMVFVKIAYMTSGFWIVLFSIMIIGFDSETTEEVAESIAMYLSAFQGTFIFFAFGFRKSMLIGVSNVFKSRNVAGRPDERIEPAIFVVSNAYI